MNVSDVGEIVGVSANTITSRKGSWIFIWDKKGKKISAKSANWNLKRYRNEKTIEIAFYAVLSMSEGIVAEDL